MELFVFLFGLFFLPVSEFSFHLAALQKIYLVNTRDKDLFKSTNNNELLAPLPESLRGSELEEKARFHHLIKLDLSSSMKLFFMSKVCSLVQACRCAKAILNKKL